jgi:hypothetical protein
VRPLNFTVRCRGGSVEMETLTQAPAAVPNANPHVLLRQVVGLALWVGIPSILVGVSAFIMCSTLAALTFADAWKSGIYKRADRSGFLNISPMAWGIAVAFLFIVAYPAYLIEASYGRFAVLMPTIGRW